MTAKQIVNERTGTIEQMIQAAVEDATNTADVWEKYALVRSILAGVQAEVRNMAKEVEEVEE